MCEFCMFTVIMVCSEKCTSPVPKMSVEVCWSDFCVHDYVSCHSCHVTASPHIWMYFCLFVLLCGVFLFHKVFSWLLTWICWFGHYWFHKHSWVVVQFLVVFPLLCFCHNRHAKAHKVELCCWNLMWCALCFIKCSSH